MKNVGAIIILVAFVSLFGISIIGMGCGLWPGVCRTINIWFGYEANAADNLAPCMTLREARAKYPTTHLWWYYDDNGRKCWSNRRGGPPRMKDPVMGTHVGQLSAIKHYPRPFDAGAEPFTPAIVLDPRGAPDDIWPPLTEFDERWGVMPLKPDGEN